MGSFCVFWLYFTTLALLSEDKLPFLLFGLILGPFFLAEKEKCENLIIGIFPLPLGISRTYRSVASTTSLISYFSGRACRLPKMADDDLSNFLRTQGLLRVEDRLRGLGAARSVDLLVGSD